MSRLRYPARRGQDQAPGRLYDAALQPIPGPVGAGEPGVRRSPLWHARSATRRTRHDCAARAQWPRRSARGRTFRRLEAAPRAWRLHLAESAVASAGRADGRRRSESAARFLERNPCARRGRPDRFGLDPLHGRSRALPRDRLYRLWLSAGAWHCGGSDRQIGTLDYTVTGDQLHKLQDELAGKPGVDMVAPFGTSLHVSGRDKSALDATIAPWRNNKGLHWQHGEPSLEDVFIELMTRSKDNFQ